MKEVLRDVERVFRKRLERVRLVEKAAAEISKTVLMDSETIIRKVLSELVSPVLGPTKIFDGLG